jgi:hypothetical protein
VCAFAVIGKKRKQPLTDWTRKIKATLHSRSLLCHSGALAEFAVRVVRDFDGGMIGGLLIADDCFQDIGKMSVSYGAIQNESRSPRLIVMV